jgi:hypothetical protein
MQLREPVVELHVIGAESPAVPLLAREAVGVDVALVEDPELG